MNSLNGRCVYFAYGSNLLQQRLILNTPSVQREGIGRLRDYRLEFGLQNGMMCRWSGGVATIVPCPGDTVWGAVWSLTEEDLPTLDEQENVSGGFYRPMSVSVERGGEQLLCRSYQMNAMVPAAPSPQYLKVVCLGARQSGLPADYQRWLQSIPSNGFPGPVPIWEEIQRYL